MLFILVFMKAMIYKKFGTPDVLFPSVLSKPEPNKNEVLIRVIATTVTAADCIMRRGDTLLSRIMLGLNGPRKKYQILGLELSGRIESIGKGVSRFSVGDDVFAFRGFGTGCYAEYKCMSENGSVSLKPGNMSFAEAASVVDGATTALFFLKEKARLQKGQHILINGASGSIGTFAVQLAKYFGAEVTGVCSTKNMDYVKSLGADKVIDYTKQDFAKTGDTYDVIFDTVGKSSFSICKPALENAGKYVVTVMTLKRIIQSILSRFSGNKKLIFAMSVNKSEELEYIRDLIEKGHLKTYIDRQYPFQELPDAHAYVDKGHKKGNVVIEI
jgi:NADPH2:quinone reductase